jgi:hypothetical protein
MVFSSSLLFFCEVDCVVVVAPDVLLAEADSAGPRSSVTIVKTPFERCFGNAGWEGSAPFTPVVGFRIPIVIGISVLEIFAEDDPALPWEQFPPALCLPPLTQRTGKIAVRLVLLEGDPGRAISLVTELKPGGDNRLISHRGGRGCHGI